MRENTEKERAWLVKYCPPPDLRTWEQRIVLPMNDIEAHIDHSHECGCNPDVYYIGMAELIIHNAFDGRS